MHASDEHWMRRAIRLAMNGRGRVEPNPMVGCVIVKDGPSTALGPGRLIGEGYHQQFGGPHAEPNALANCTESPAGATVYVTLEPCCHTNKKTPPCVPKLIEAKVARVVIGCLDPNPDVNGKGVGQLDDAEIDVIAPGPVAGQTGRSVLEAECRQLLAPFLARVVHRRPYVTLKWAETADGKVALRGGRPLRITNELSNRRVHELRARCDAIMIGIRTALADDPLLTARGVETPRELVRIVLDPHLKLPLTSRLVATAGEHPLVVYCSYRSEWDKTDVVAALRARGATVQGMAETGWGFSIPHLLAEIGRRDITHLLVEPGPKLADSLIHYADRAWVFRSPTPLGDPRAPSAPAVGSSDPDDHTAGSHYIPAATADLAGDTLTEYFKFTSPVYSAAVPSADFVLATAPRAG